jgi:hypothetical protein
VAAHIVLQTKSVGDRISIAWTEPRKLLPTKLLSPNPAGDVDVVESEGIEARHQKVSSPRPAPAT